VVKLWGDMSVAFKPYRAMSSKLFPNSTNFDLRILLPLRNPSFLFQGHCPILIDGGWRMGFRSLAHAYSVISSEGNNYPAQGVASEYLSSMSKTGHLLLPVSHAAICLKVDRLMGKNWRRGKSQRLLLYGLFLMAFLFLWCLLTLVILTVEERVRQIVS